MYLWKAKITPLILAEHPAELFLVKCLAESKINKKTDTSKNGEQNLNDQTNLTNFRLRFNRDCERNCVRDCERSVSV